jgi:hypothetical protein
MKDFIKRAARFVKETIVVAYKKVKVFLRGVWNHIETVAVLVLATYGLATLIGELPFLITLPMWVETPFVAPVLAVIGIKILLRISERRMIRRQTRGLQGLRLAT